MADQERDTPKKIGGCKVIEVKQEIDPLTGKPIKVTVLEPRKPTREGSLNNGHPPLKVIGQVG